MKKYRILFVVLLAAGMGLLSTSCNKFLRDDININPTQSADMDPAFQLTYTQVWLSQNRYEHWRTNFILTSCFIQHTANTASYFEGDKYTYNIPSYNHALFDAAYTREVKNVVDLINRTADDPDAAVQNIRNAARIQRVYMMSRMTDLYGDVPYSEAGKGFIDQNFFPKYDDQQSIYTDMLKELAEATAGIDASLSVKGDVFFGGDASKWKKWGNSLRLRLGMRLSKADAAKAQSEVSAAISGGVMTSNDDNALIVHDNIRQNGNSQVFYADQSMRLAKAFVDFMKANDDPRLPIYGAIYMDDATLGTYPIPNASTSTVNVLANANLSKVVGPGGENILAYAVANSDYTGIDGLPNGLVTADLGDGEKNRFVAPNYQNIGPLNTPYVHQHYAEVEFLLAEAAVRDWGASDAKGHFLAGVRAMVEMLSKYPGNSAALVAGADIDGFVATHSANWDAAGSNDAKLELIGTALWSSLYLDGYEAFASWRRTGYPNLTPVDHSTGITGGTIPRRCHYPQSEQGLNTTNYQAAISRQGADSYTTRVWWDK